MRQASWTTPITVAQGSVGPSKACMGVGRVRPHAVRGGAMNHRFARLVKIRTVATAFSRKPRTRYPAKNVEPFPIARGTKGSDMAESTAKKTTSIRAVLL